MDELSEALQALLRSPATLQKLQGLLQPSEEEHSTPSTPPATASPDLSGQLAALLPLLSNGGQNGGVKQEASAADMGGETAAILGKLLPILGSLREENENTALLRALRPYLHGERSVRLDHAIQMAQMARLLPLLQSQS